MKSIVHEKTFKRRSSIYLIIKFIKSLKDSLLFFIFFIAFLGFSLSTKNSTILIVGAVIIFTIIISFSLLLEWYNFKYLITEKGITVISGRFTKNEFTVPYNKIISCNQVNNRFLRFFNIASINLDLSLQGEKNILSLEFIDEEDIYIIQKKVSYFNDIDTEEKISELKSYSVSKKNILFFSILSLDFLIIIPIFQWFYNSDLSVWLSLNNYFSNILLYFNKTEISYIIGILSLITLSITVGYLRYFIRFGNFELKYNSSEILINQGFSSKHETVIPKENINAIIIQHNFLQKVFNLSKVKFISMKSSVSDEIKFPNVLFPIINNEVAVKEVSNILPSFFFDFKMVGIKKNTLIIKLIRTSYVWIFSFITMFLFFEKHLYISYIIFIFVVVTQIIRSYKNRYLFNNSFIEYKNSGINTLFIIVPHKRVEELKISQSFIQKRFGVVSLHVFVRANPIYKLKIHDIPVEIAEKYFVFYRDSKKKAYQD